MFLNQILRLCGLGPNRLTCMLFWLSRIQEESFVSAEPDMPLSRWGSKVRHMTGSGWALTRLSSDLWVTSHSNREPSSYPANRRGPGPESGWKRGRVIRPRGGKLRCGVAALQPEEENLCVLLETERGRGYHPGSSH